MHSLDDHHTESVVQ